MRVGIYIEKISRGFRALAPNSPIREVFGWTQAEVVNELCAMLRNEIYERRRLGKPMFSTWDSLPAGLRGELIFVSI
jgi:hypothetical protein